MTTLADVIVTEDSGALPGNPDNARKLLAEAVAEDAPPTTEAQPAKAEADVPEKFRGKSVKEIVDSYQNLETRLGQMANDLGQQRALTDRILQLDLKRNDDLRKNTPAKAEVPKVTTSDLLDRPHETLERAMDAREKSIEDKVNDRLARLEAALTQQSFVQKHSDYQTVVNSPEFVEWVKARPTRLRAAAAANQGNWQIADELLTEFKGDRRSPSREESTAEDTDNLDAARRASLETSGNAGGKNGTDGKQKGKVYKRVDLIRLRMEDPDSYYDEGFQNEIRQAHAEGRVK